MRRLKKKIYFKLWALVFLVLVVIRYATNLASPVGKGEDLSADSLQSAVAEEPSVKTVVEESVPVAEEPAPAKGRDYHRIFGVHSYTESFPDVQDVQILAARRWGVSPVRNREQAEERKQELVYVGSNPYFIIDKGMTSSIPYLVPRAAELLQDISRCFLDSLAVKGVPLHRIIVSSVLRTEEDVARLLRSNPNATAESCHRYGTTFDIPYNRYNTVSPPGLERREVSSDTLKYVLSEVLRDLREQKRCYVKYEIKQACFHITTR